ncbi:MAG: adenylate/guanylate cyclase domain-containing protein [Verrucomicrobiales bacterium]|nr:adenylate/guanylate cyclase domain-containing protein [Verrucomicrobiales bacterium]
MFIAQAIGSVFNIQYNLTHLTPLLSEGQQEAFEKGISHYNLIAYPILVVLWGVFVFRLRKAPASEKQRQRNQRRVVNLPFAAMLIAAAGWLFCIPVLLTALKATGEVINPHVFFHLPVSVGVATFIALTIGYFSIDCARQTLLFKYFFSKTSPSKTQCAFRLSISGRGSLWTIAASICPILTLLLLFLSPAPEAKNFSFAISVAAVGIFCAIVSSALMGRLVAQPVETLRNAAQAIGKGDLDVHLDNMRADEFGDLADEFNAMVAGLREKEHVTNTFGRHVGARIAQELLEAKEELSGVDRILSVLFADIRGFTTRCEGLSPKEAVRLLNLYHETMTGIIEANGGIVNQLIGDGIMALFGATGNSPHHANDATSAAIGMIRGLEDLNKRLEKEGFESIRIGVGVNTGPAVVGTIGSPMRKEYTAIGDTVNTAARIEGLTKEVGCEILISHSTWEASNPKPDGKELEPMEIRGRRDHLILHQVSH